MGHYYCAGGVSVCRHKGGLCHYAEAHREVLLLCTAQRGALILFWALLPSGVTCHSLDITAHMLFTS